MMERRKAGGNGAKIRPLEFGGGRLPLVVNASGWLAPTPKSKMMEKAKEIVLIDSTSKRRKM
jgi:hypothetical protein